MNLKISFLEIKIHETKSDFAQAIIDKQEPQLWLWHIPLTYPVPYEEFMDMIKKGENNQAHFTAHFDFDKLEDIAERTFIEVNSELDFLGTAKITFKEGNTTYHDITIKNKEDWRTILHEYIHLCCDIPIKYNKAHSYPERAMEIATEILIRNDKEIYSKIEQASVRGIMKRYQNIINRYDADYLIKRITEINNYSGIHQDSRSLELKHLSRHLFYDTFRHQLKQRENQLQEVTQ